MTNYTPKPLAYWKDHDPTELNSWSPAASVRQQFAIRGIGNSQHIDFDAACLELFGCPPEHLNSRAASTFIDWLKAQDIQPRHSALNFCPTCQDLLAIEADRVVCKNGHSFELATINKSEAA